MSLTLAVSRHFSKTAWISFPRHNLWRVQWPLDSSTSGILRSVWRRCLLPSKDSFSAYGLCCQGKGPIRMQPWSCTLHATRPKECGATFLSSSSKTNWQELRTKSASPGEVHRMRWRLGTTFVSCTEARGPRPNVHSYVAFVYTEKQPGPQELRVARPAMVAPKASLVHPRTLLSTTCLLESTYAQVFAGPELSAKEL